MPNFTFTGWMTCLSTVKQVQSVDMFRHVFKTFIWLLAFSVNATAPALAREISSYAFINEDGTLQIKRETIHLYGIHIPETGNHCRTNIRPAVCGSRASIALEFKIQGFVNCEIMEENIDGSLVGWCRVNGSTFRKGTDLSAYLLERGWAVALPGAPVEYRTLERIAYRRGAGIWGFTVDSVIK